MPLHTKKGFAALCGITTKQLATNALPDRRKVIYSGDYINDEIEPNKSFLEKWQDRNKGKSPKPTPEKKVKELHLLRPPSLKEMRAEIEKEDAPWLGEDNEEIPKTTGLDAKKLKTQILKMEKEIEKLTLANSKAQGEVVPVGLMDAILLQERQSILMESKNTWQDILSIFGKRRDLTAEERADIRGEFIDRLNEMMKRSAEITEKSIKDIVAQFSVKRGKGERVG